MESEVDSVLKDISPLVEQMARLVDDSLPYYRSFVDKVESGVVTDLRAIEWELDLMLSACFDERVLVLYKRVLRKLVDEHCEVVKFYVELL